MITSEIIIFGLFGLATIFFIAGFFSAFRYAKDIFTPTRKSALLSGLYFLLSGISCPLLVAFMASEKFNLFGASVLTCLVLLPFGIYTILGYLYALSKEKNEFGV